MLNVILVDDEQYTRMGLRSLIDWESCGMKIIEEADNGEDALALIKQTKPDIVITDIRMPVLDGLELIRMVTEQLSEEAPAFIIISGYNDFKYAQQAVRYGVHDFILKPIDQEEMTQTLLELNEKLTTARLEKLESERLIIPSVIETLIRGEASAELIEEWHKRLHYSKRFTYVFVELNDVHPWSERSKDGTLQLFKDNAQREIKQMLPDFEHIFLHEHRGRIGIIITDMLLVDYEGSVEIFINEMKHSLERLFADRVFIYVGSSVDCLSRLPESYQTAKDALQYKHIFDDDKIVMYEWIHDLSLNFIEVNHTMFNQIVQLLEESKEVELTAMVDELFEQFRSKRFAPEAIKMNIHHCVTTIIRTIKEMGGDEKELLTLEPIISWHDLNLTLAELKRIFMEFITESGQLIKKLRHENNKGNIYKIKQYIENNFDQNISLKSIASKFYMNPVYLGQLFKKHYGQYFNDYVLQLRINEAKKLLRQTDLRIYEIANRVGFKNADYFVTQFEKIEQMTPTEYRNKKLYTDQ